MTAPTQKVGHGAVLEYTTVLTSPFTGWVAVGALVGNVDTQEKLNTASAYPHDKAGIVHDATSYDPGTISGEVLYDSSATAHLALETAIRNKTPLAFRVTQVDGGAEKEIGLGFITDWKKSNPDSDYIKASFTITRYGTLVVS